MNDLGRLRALSDAATPGPWIRKWQSLDVHAMTGDGVLSDQRNIDLAVAAVNYVRDLFEEGDVARYTPEELVVIAEQSGIEVERA